jgi:hypothetical protein
LSQKRHFFAEFFGENIQKIITSVPDDVVEKSPELKPTPFSVKINIGIIFTLETNRRKNFSHFCNFQTSGQIIYGLPNKRKFAQCGHPVCNQPYSFSTDDSMHQAAEKSILVF